MMAHFKATCYHLKMVARTGSTPEKKVHAEAYAGSPADILAKCSPPTIAIHALASA
jgi:hypothetical protein